MSPPSTIRPSPHTVSSNTAGLSRIKNPSPSEAADSSSADSSSDSEPVESRLLRRPPRFTSHKAARNEDADDEDDAPAFLPFSSPSVASGGHQDPSATLRGDPRQIARKNAGRTSTEVIQQSQTSDSSASSTAPAVKPNEKGVGQPQRPTGPLSPRRTAELAGRSPIGKGKVLGRDGSDGTPSMGSSFSDLDGTCSKFSSTFASQLVLWY